MMQKTKIEWVKNPNGSQGYSWNPIKGLCPVGCWYCYARKIYKRFGWPAELMLLTTELSAPSKIEKSSGIFVCSTVDLFHSEIKPHWRNELIFAWIKACPQHRFYILTKFPQNIDREMPKNVWLGVTIDNDIYCWNRIRELEQTLASIKFISIEPILNRIILPAIIKDKLDWIIVGKLTGFGHRNDPWKSWIKEIVNQAKRENIPIFLKNNLKETWGDELIQEMPE